MITAGETIDTIRKDSAGDLFGEAETSGGILDIADGEIEGLLPLEIGHNLRQRPATGLANDIADEKDFNVGGRVGYLQDSLPAFLAITESMAFFTTSPRFLCQSLPASEFLRVIPSRCHFDVDWGLVG